MAANLVKFMTGTAAQYAAAVKDANTLYFITDERRIYKGSVPYGGDFYSSVQVLPATGQLNTLYGVADGSLAYWDGTQYQYLISANITDIASNSNSTVPPTTAAVVSYVTSAIGDVEDRLDIIEGDANTNGSIEHALAEAKDYTDTLAEGQVATNTADIAALEQNKADAATTLAGYGITDAYTKTETDTAIATAVANADHLKREVVAQLPAVATADAHTIYMILNGSAGDSVYDEWMVINGAWEKMGTSAVDLTGYATETYCDNAAQAAEDAAIAAAAQDATTKASQALQDAEDYADGLMTAEVTRADAAYATAAQGLLAESAVQSVIEGDGNGQIKVDGTNINVHGLGSAAYTNSNAYDAAGSASTAETNANTYTDEAIAAAALVWEPIA